MGGNWASTVLWHWEKLFAVFISVSSQPQLVFCFFFPSSLMKESAPLNVGQTLFWSSSSQSCFFFLLLMSRRDQRQPAAAIVVISHKWQLMKEWFLLISAASAARQSRVTRRFAFLLAVCCCFLIPPLFFCLFLSSVLSRRGWGPSSPGSIADFLISLAR